MYSGAVVDLVFGAIITLLGVVMLLRPDASAAVLSMGLRRLRLGTPSRAGMYARGVIFLVVGVGLLIIGWHFRHAH